MRVTGGGGPEGRNRRLTTIGGLTLLYVFLFLFIRSRVDTSLLYLKGPGLFVLDFNFFRRYLALPGRPARYLTLFLQELYWFPTLGALAASGLILLTSVCVRAVFVRLVPDRGGFAFTLGAWAATLLPALLALVGYDRYEPVDLMSIAVTLLLALAYARSFPKHPFFRAIVFAALLVFVILLNPDMAPILASLCGLWEMVGKQRCVTGLLYAATGLLPYFTVGAYVFNIDTMSELSVAAPVLFPAPYVLTIAVLALLSGICVIAAVSRRSRVALFVGLLVLLFGLQWRFLTTNSELFCFSVLFVPAMSWVVAGNPAVKAWKPGRVARGALLAGVSAGFLSVAVLSFDHQQQLCLKMVRSARDRDWTAVLDIADQLPADTCSRYPTADCMTHRALFHTGRLPRSMLDYPTHLLHMLPIPMPNMGPAPRVDAAEVADLCLDLGLVNHAELMAYHQVDKEDPREYAFELLVRVYMVKGNPAAARPILNMLKKTITHRAWAERCSALIDGTSTEEMPLGIERARADMIRRDLPADAPELLDLAQKAWDWGVVLRRLLQANGSNRMAFEYLMSAYLLLGRTGEIVQNLPALGNLGYPGIPALYQEASLLDCFLHGRRLDGPQRDFFKPSLVEEYASLVTIYDRSGRNAAATLHATEHESGHAYFDYWMALRKNAEDRKKIH